MADAFQSTQLARISLHQTRTIVKGTLSDGLEIGRPPDESKSTAEQKGILSDDPEPQGFARIDFLQARAAPESALADADKIRPPDDRQSRRILRNLLAWSVAEAPDFFGSILSGIICCCYY